MDISERQDTEVNSRALKHKVSFWRRNVTTGSPNPGRIFLKPVIDQGTFHSNLPSFDHREDITFLNLSSDFFSADCRSEIQRFFKKDSRSPISSSYLHGAIRRNSIHLIKTNEQPSFDSRRF
jgi:hypothetical protein